MRTNAVRRPILVFAALTAVFVPLMTSEHAAMGIGVRPSPSSSGSAVASNGASAAPAPAPSAARPTHPHTPKPKPSPSESGAAQSVAEQGAFYRSVLDVRPDMPGIDNQKYYYIGKAFCTSSDLGDDAFIQIQQAYAMPAGTLAYDDSIATAMVEAAPMEFIAENQALFGFDATNLDTSTLNAFRWKLCGDHRLWRAYAKFVREQLESLGPWRTDPSYTDPDQAAQLWSDDLTAWESALSPYLPAKLQPFSS